ncbi:hypothetical protein PCK2_000800 [Pneumocystis canis]|nr:hypothetical protein PCK2_000800 [Pneumocystis canis]
MREQIIRMTQSSMKPSESPIPLSKSYVLVATMVYDIFSTYSIQTFPIPADIKQLNIPIENVVFRILSNWGNNKFTCLYRVRVHGIKTIGEGFRTFLSSAGTSEYKNRIICEWIDSLSQIQDVLRNTELRLYSSSLLFAYESDIDALKKKIDKDSLENNDRQGHDNNSTDDSIGDDSSHFENGLSTISICRLIDFAHAHWVAGQGPDENVLHGITSLKTLLMDISNEYH